MAKKLGNNAKIKGMAALLALLILLLGVGSSAAHDDSGYSHDATIGYTNKGWMGQLPNEMLLSQMSIPGTHDTMTYQVPGFFCTIGTDSVKTQSMDLKTQLESGIRLLDIRARHINDSFDMHHSSCYLGADFDDVLEIVIDFLVKNSSETVLMKIKEEYNAKDNSRSFEETLAAYVNDPAYAGYF